MRTVRDPFIVKARCDGGSNPAMICTVHCRALSGSLGIPFASSTALFIPASPSFFFLGTNSTHNFACPPLFEYLLNIPRACPISLPATSFRSRLDLASVVLYSAATGLGIMTRPDATLWQHPSVLHDPGTA